MVYWKLCLLVRKFLFGIVVVLLDSNVEAQVRFLHLGNPAWGMLYGSRAERLFMMRCKSQPGVVG
jgi:hypothetical protein